jgi:multiple sugar transport system substrate-binding protein
MMTAVAPGRHGLPRARPAARGAALTGAVRRAYNEGGMSRSIAAAVAILLSVAVVGCAPRVKKPGARTRVTLWSGFVGVDQDNFEILVRMFNRSQNRYFVENHTTIEEDTRTFRAITAGTPPDLFFLWQQAYIGALAANGAVRPLDGYLRRSGLREQDFVPGALDQARYRGKLYGVPFLIDATGLFWNREAFAEAGLDPNRPPRTTEEALDFAVKLTKRDARGNLVRLGLQPPTLQEVIAIFGGRLADPVTGRITANDPRNVEALEWYVRLCDVQGGGLRIDSFQQGFGEFDSANNQFFVGKIAMMFSGEWWPVYITRYSPATDYGVADLPYPAKYPQQKGVTFLGGNFMAIPTESKHPDGAWAFMRWTQTRQAQVTLARVGHNLPNIRAYLMVPELTQGDREKEAFGAVGRIAARGKGVIFPATPVNVAYISELQTAAQRAVRKTVTPKQALDAVQRRLEEYMAPYQGL